MANHRSDIHFFEAQKAFASLGCSLRNTVTRHWGKSPRSDGQSGKKEVTGRQKGLKLRSSSWSFYGLLWSIMVLFGFIWFNYMVQYEYGFHSGTSFPNEPPRSLSIVGWHASMGIFQLQSVLPLGDVSQSITKHLLYTILSRNQASK